MFCLLGFSFLVGVFYGIFAVIILQLYLAYKLFNYQDYMRTSKEIEDNRAFWKERMNGYQELIDKEMSELGPYNHPTFSSVKENPNGNSSFSFSDEDDMNDKDYIKNMEQMMKDKVIQKSLYEINDNNSNILHSTNYAPLSMFKQDTLNVLNIGTNQNEDENFEVQFRARSNASERFAKYFIGYYEKMSKVECQINFKKIIDQKTRYSITKHKTFNIFKKGSKWVQIR